MPVADPKKLENLSDNGVAKRKLKIKKYDLGILLEEHEKIRHLFENEYKQWESLSAKGEEKVK
ncbi:hypothetical protein [uncultured Turicimonas sp.]|uniref:hypothetical protein n=1 Tax=uncultured Turicimonas sp. TaxID=1918607 RepID=UPI002804B70E|nr:hypothetical protein [uncultured Turicimonas sp.]